LRSEFYAQLLGRAWRLAKDGNRRQIELAMMEIETALRGLSRANSGPWRRLLGKAYRELESRLAYL
jgi:hypothetical protein